MTQHPAKPQRPRSPMKKARRPQVENKAPALSAKEISASFKPQGNVSTQRKNRSQRLWMKSLFPDLFLRNHPMPMKTGIKDDMLTQIVRRGLDISEERLQAALRTCCSSMVYRTRQFTFRFRRDLNGVAVEKITKEDQKYAWNKLMEYRQQHKLPQINISWFKGSRKKGPSKGRTAMRKGFKAEKV